VWWLPKGNTFPVPAAPFTLGKKNIAHQDTLRLRFRINFGQGVNAVACAGCPLQIVFYDGRRFATMYEQPIHFADTTGPLPGNPRVTFGPHCTPISFAQIISPTVAYTHTLALENWDTASRTYTITASSTQAWPYRYYTAAGTAGPLVPVQGPPFTVTLAAASTYTPGCYRLMAVYTPTQAMPSTVSEAWVVTATSRLSPTIQAVGRSFALGPDIDQTIGGAFTLYLPIILSNQTP
jgi:hypothetical protein